MQGWFEPQDLMFICSGGGFVVLVTRKITPEVTKLMAFNFCHVNQKLQSLVVHPQATISKVMNSSLVQVIFITISNLLPNTAGLILTFVIMERD